MHRVFKLGKEFQLFSRPNVRMGKKSDFGHVMIVGARQGGLSISETADLLGIFMHNCI